MRPHAIQRGNIVVYEGKRWPAYGDGRRFEVLNPCSSEGGDTELMSVRSLDNNKVFGLPREGSRVISVSA